MSERPQLQPALGLVKDRLTGPPPRRNPAPRPEPTPAADSGPDQGSDPGPDTETPSPAQDAPAAREATANGHTDGIDNPASKEPTATRKPRKATSVRASDNSEGGTRRTTVSIPQDLAETLRNRLRAERGVSQAQFILNAIEANAHRLTELVDAERPAPVASGGLFPDRRPTRPTNEARTTINFDTTERNLQVVDTLVHHHHADSRSHLVRAALRAALH